MSKSMHTALAAVAFTALAWVPSASAQVDVDFPDGQVPLEIVVDGKEPLPFVPFTLEDICKTAGTEGCSQRYQSDEIIRYVKTELVGDIEREIVLFEGTVTDYVEYLNGIEAELAEKGYSLRDDVKEFLFREIPTNIRQLRVALLNALGTYAPGIIDRIRDPLVGDDCPLLPADKIDELPDAVRDRAPAELERLKGTLRKLNDSQRVLCALGFSALDVADLIEFESPGAGADGALDDLMERLVRKRDEILAELGLSSYLKAFNLVSLDEVKEYAAIAKDIHDLVTAKEFPGPERLESLRQKLNAKLPESLEIPAVPNIPAVEPPTRQDLDVKKRKDWEGFDFGDRRLVGTGAMAYTEVRGNEDTRTFEAYGKASAYLVNNEVNLISGFGFAEVGPERLALRIEMQTLGQQLFEPVNEEASVSIVKKDDSLFSYELEQKYRYSFAIGFIPVSVNMGARASIGLGYEAGIETTRIYGKIVPRASAAGFAELEAGVGGVYAVGAGANLVILELKAPLTGEAGLRWDEADYPYINLEIRADAVYEYLKGNVFAYAEYTVPKVSLPPWELKRDTVELFRFPGQKVEQAIFNWGLEVGRHGTVLKGDLIDREDREQAGDLDEAILLEQRERALAEREQLLMARAASLFDGLRVDLNSEYNAAALQRSDEVALYSDQLVFNLEQFAEVVDNTPLR